MYRRRIKEAIRIYQRWPGLNRDTGLDIPAIILQLVSHDPEGSCDTNDHYLPSPDEGREILRKIQELFPPLFDSVCRMFSGWKKVTHIVIISDLELTFNLFTTVAALRDSYLTPQILTK